MDPSFPEMPEWGWRPWPDSEEYSYFFVRVLATAQGGAATISECISASKNIVPGDGESWFRAWNQLAETNRARADRAFERRSLQAATSNWLRASNYYRTSGLFLAAEDERRRAAILDMRKCARLYLENSVPKSEVLQIPFGKNTMEAYYLRANGIARQPVVVCVGSTDDFKEDLLCSIPRIASESGYSVLLVDVIGAGTGIRDTNAIESIVEVEDVISHWIDYLWDRSDVDGSRLAIYGMIRRSLCNPMRRTRPPYCCCSVRWRLMGLPGAYVRGETAEESRRYVYRFLANCATSTRRAAADHRLSLPRYNRSSGQASRPGCLVSPRCRA
jgi:hypothetical protein